MLPVKQTGRPKGSKDTKPRMQNSAPLRAGQEASLDLDGYCTKVTSYVSVLSGNTVHSLDEQLFEWDTFGSKVNPLQDGNDPFHKDWEGTDPSLGS